MRYLLGVICSLLFTSCNVLTPQEYIVNRIELIRIQVSDEEVVFGTGGFVKSKSDRILLLTNEHVCAESPNKEVAISHFDFKELPGTIIKMDHTNDLCAIDAQVQHSYFRLADTIYPHEGIYTSGFPSEHYVYSQGFAIGNDYAYNHQIISTTLFADEGQSGSPVINDKLELVGVLEAIEESDKSAYLIPVNLVRDFLADL